MESENGATSVSWNGQIIQYILYDYPPLVQQLQIMPFVQIFVVAVFIIVGFTGVLIGFVVMTMKEPGRHHSEKKGVPLSVVGQYLKSHQSTYICLLLGTSVYFIAYLAYLA